MLFAAGACLLSLLSFAAGHWAGNRGFDERARSEGYRQMLEFIAAADALGILDRERLNQLNADANNNSETNGPADVAEAEGGR